MILLPLSIIVIFMAIGTVFSRKIGTLQTYGKEFSKLLLGYFYYALMIIVAFAAIYFVFVAEGFSDLSDSEKDEIREINSADTTEAQERLFDHLQFNNISLDTENPMLILFDLVYFSAMTFFTIGFGDITVTGLFRVVVMFESFVGVGFTSVYIAFSMNLIKRQYTSNDVLEYRIGKGWEVVNFNPMKNGTKILLVNQDDHFDCLTCFGNSTFVWYLKMISGEWSRHIINNVKDGDKNDIWSYNNYLQRVAIFYHVRVKQFPTHHYDLECEELRFKYLEYLTDLNKELLDDTSIDRDNMQWLDVHSDMIKVIGILEDMNKSRVG